MRRNPLDPAGDLPEPPRPDETVCVTCRAKPARRGAHVGLVCKHAMCSACFKEFEDESHLRVCLVLRVRLSRWAVWSDEDKRRELIRHMAEVQRGHH